MGTVESEARGRDCQGVRQEAGRAAMRRSIARAREDKGDGSLAYEYFNLFTPPRGKREGLKVQPSCRKRRCFRAVWLIMAAAVATITFCAVLFASGKSGKVRARCEAAAEDLNARYARAEPFRSEAGSLEGWMESNGILLTCCSPQWGFGFLPTCYNYNDGGEWSMDHVSASWVGNGTWAAYPTGVCRVLKPSKVDVKCVYPTDGASHGRSDGGCGPPADPFHWFMTTSHEPTLGAFENETGVDYAGAYEHHLRELKGADASWSDVKCSEWSDTLFTRTARFTIWESWEASEGSSCERAELSGPPSSSPASARPYSEVLNMLANATLGHPFCVDDLSDRQEAFHWPANPNARWWIDYGSCSWPKDMFAESEAVKMAVIDKIKATNPEEGSTGIYNEVVLNAGASHPDVTSSVLWVNDPAFGNYGLGGASLELMRLASWQHARDMGGDVPVLEVDPSPEALEEGRTFTCDPLWLLQWQVHSQT